MKSFLTLSLSRPHMRIFGTLCSTAFLFLFAQSAIANEAGNLDQGKNGGVGNTPISPVNWVNGNLNQNDSHYQEGDSIPYRLTLTGLTSGSHTVDIEWDIKHSGANAIDFITTKKQGIAEDVNPLTGLGTFVVTNTFPIPSPITSSNVFGVPQPQTAFSNLPPSLRLMTIYNGSISSMTYITNDLGDLSASVSSTGLRIVLTTTNPTVVLSWGGHIGTRFDWGVGNSAGGISGSPYHTRFLELDGSGGNQDRSLSAAAICTPPTNAIVGPSPVCGGSTNTYTDTSDGASFAWTISGSGTILGSTTGSSVNVLAGASGSYTLIVTATASGGCTSTATNTVTIDSVPTPSITGPTPVCPLSTGNTYTADAGFSSYAWSITGNGSIVGATNGQSVTVTAGGTCGQNFTIKLKVTNGDGCTATNAATIIVSDTTAPTITSVPTGGDLGCNPTNLPTDSGIAAQVTATDDCSTPAVNVTHVDGGTPCAMTRTFKIVASDHCLNAATNTVVFTWKADTTPPALSGLPAALITNQCAGEIPAPATVTAVDNCDGSVTVNYSAITNGSSCNLTITRTWSASDSCGNSTNFTQTIAIHDTTPPQITSVPTGSNLGCNPTNIPSDDSIKALVLATDNCTTPTIAVSHADSGTPCAMTRTFTIIATDDCGNSATNASPAYTWKADTTAPVFSNLPPTSVSTECAGDVPAPAVVTAVDNCDGAVNVNYSASTNGSDCDLTITRTWSAADDCGNSTNFTQTIAVHDSTPPQITAAPTNTDLGCNPTNIPTDNDITAQVTATDNCTTPTVAVTHVDSGTPCAMTRTFAIVATDGCLNAVTNNVSCTWKEDTTPPVFSNLPPASVTSECATGISAPPTVTAVDDCDGSVTVNYNATTNGTLCDLTITRTWSASDSCGNSTNFVQTITAHDTTPPVINCPTNVTIDCTVSIDPTNTGVATATDACSGVESLTYSDVQTNGICDGDYVVTRTWLATDNCGNSNSCVQTITVQDLKNPILSVPSTLSVECDTFEPISSNEPVTLTAAEFNQLGDGYSVSDDCDDVTVTYWDNGPSGVCSKTYTRTFVATDSCSNSTTVLQTITENCTCESLFITDTMLCTLLNNQFQLLYTPLTKSSCDKLNASTPGQYYLNAFFTGAPGSNATFKITLPYPWVTQGATPIHAYSSVTSSTTNGQTCLTPGTGIYSNTKQVKLSNYSPQKFGSTYTFPLTVKVPASGFIYLNVHLDYGLKGLPTSYGSNLARDATQCGRTNVLIPNNQPYGFSVGGSMTNTTSVTSYNTFQ